jgi:carbamoyl-phosphate synthase small subunit
MRERGAKISVFPGSASAEEIMSIKPDGLFVSNGPGDPTGVSYIVKELKKLTSSGLPTFGICFGHQLLSLAFGAKTYKLKFGHRGANHPVMDLDTKEIAITSQNHGFAVDLKSLPSELEATHVNLNDQTNEGIRHKKLPIFSVQYHPEAAPGPHDAEYLFNKFMSTIRV